MSNRKRRRIIIDDEESAEESDEEGGSACGGDCEVKASVRESPSRQRRRIIIDDSDDNEHDSSSDSSSDEDTPLSLLVKKNPKARLPSKNSAASNNSSSSSSTSSRSTTRNSANSPSSSSSSSSSNKAMSSSSKRQRSLARLSERQLVSQLQAMLVTGDEVGVKDNVFVVEGVAVKSITLRGDGCVRYTWERAARDCKKEKWFFNLVGGASARSRLLLFNNDLPDWTVPDCRAMFEHLHTVYGLRSQGATARQRQGDVYERALAEIFDNDPSIGTSLEAGMLQGLFRLYDNEFMQGKLAQMLRIKFVVSKKKGSTGGLFEKKGRTNVITISSYVLFSCLQDKAETTRVHGVSCRTRLRALMCVFEHEQLHAIAENFFHPCHFEAHGGHTMAFQLLARSMFGHTSMRHELLCGDIQEHDKQVRKNKKMENSLRASLDVDEVIYALQDSGTNFSIKKWRRGKLPPARFTSAHLAKVAKEMGWKSTKTMALKLIKLNSKTLRVLATGCGFKQTDMVVPYCYMLCKEVR